MFAITTNVKICVYQCTGLVGVLAVCVCMCVYGVCVCVCVCVCVWCVQVCSKSYLHTNSQVFLKAGYMIIQYYPDLDVSLCAYIQWKV